MGKQKNIRLMEQWAASNSEHDIDKFLALFNADIIYDDLPLGIVATTEAQLRELMEETISAIPDWKMTLVTAIADEERGAVEWVMSGTHTGDFPGLPASGKSFELRGSAIAQFSGGRISRWTDFWCLDAFKKQLGHA